MKPLNHLLKLAILLGLLSQLIFIPVSMAATISSGGSGGLGFECKLGFCQCTGGSTSGDCKRMAQNCSDLNSFGCYDEVACPDTISGFDSCLKKNPKGDLCQCKTASKENPGTRRPSGILIPRSLQQNQAPSGSGTVQSNPIKPAPGGLRNRTQLQRQAPAKSTTVIKVQPATRPVPTTKPQPATRSVPTTKIQTLKSAPARGTCPPPCKRCTIMVGGVPLCNDLKTSPKAAVK